MSSSSLLFGLLVIVVVVLVYRPILKLARNDMARRREAGLGSGIVYAVLLLPIFGPCSTCSCGAPCCRNSAFSGAAARGRPENPEKQYFTGNPPT
ncbi:hypothetical protein [Neolewinella litorea]|uniref:Uncharacterized protein n=1 Tax=Neolewinella litorea TaxID=2562452 RepID=A0A4S4N8G7_9BACT|nr:hypothetical protein [Neolewinella litorea]THH35504.1 hypothetical protein E4021_16410 [Neolewinella litorea]